MSNAIKCFISRRGPWLLVGLIVLFVVLVRVRLRDMPLERDEGEYAYAGQLILKGVPPYQEVYNMKLPGTYAAYAAIMAVFGQTPAGIHLGVMLVNLGSIVLVYLLGRKLLDETTGVVAAAVFALMSLSPSVLGLAGHATHFVTFFALAGILVLLRACAPEQGTQNAECRRRKPEVRSPESGVTGQWSAVSSQAARTATTDHTSRLTFHVSRCALSGFLFGLAFLMKQQGIFFGIFGFLYLAWTGIQARQKRKPAPRHPPLRRPTYRSGIGQAATTVEPSREDVPPPDPPSTSSRSRYQLSTTVYRLTWFSAGCALPYAATCLVLWAAGVFSPFWFWTVAYAGKYASLIPAMDSGDMLRNGLRAVAGPNLGLWLLPWAGALVMWWEDRLEGGNPKFEVRSPRSEFEGQERRAMQSSIVNRESQIPCARFFLTVFFFCSFASISVGFYFREHYFITLLPALALLSGVAASRALHLLRHDKTIELLLALPIFLLLAIGLGAALVGNSAFWFDYSPAEAVKYSYGTSLFSDAVQVGDYLRTNAPPSARVAILGSEPEILFYSCRRSATGYIYTYPLMEEHAFASTMQQQMIEEIERSKPDYAVYIDDNYSWLPHLHSDRRILDWWNAYWTTNMDVVLTRDIQGKAEIAAQVFPMLNALVHPAEQQYSAQAFPMLNAPERPAEQRYLLVLKRKPK